MCGKLIMSDLFYIVVQFYKLKTNINKTIHIITSLLYFFIYRLFACQNNIHDKAQFCEKTCDKCGLIIFCDGDTLPEHIHSTFKCLITGENEKN